MTLAEQVVEAGCPEVVTQALGNCLVVSEHDAGENGTALARGTAGQRTFHVCAEVILDRCEAAASSGRTPAVSAQHDVDAVAPQPRPLVEAVLRASRLLSGPAS